jgi:hypothetical protein
MDQTQTRIAGAVTARYSTAVGASLTFELVVEDFLDGSVYYVEFGKGPDDFCYAFVDERRVRLCDDGVQLVKDLQMLLDKRRTVWQRLKEFSIVDAVGALIALGVTAAFIVLVAIPSGQVSKEFLSIFGIIVGYYFGKSAVTSK